MYPHHWGHMYRCGRATSRFFWFAFGAGFATWWHCHHDAHAWVEARQCMRDRIPQRAYPPPGTALPPSPFPNGPQDPAEPQPQAQMQGPPPQRNDGHGRHRHWDRWDHWGWWGGRERDARAQQQDGGRAGWGPAGRDSAAPGWGRDAAAREGAWGPPPPPATHIPGSQPGQGEKDIVQQATDTITELSEATLNNLLVTVESLKAKLAEHRMQREQQEREIQALREAKFKQFEEWQRQLQAQQEKEAAEKAAEPPRRLV
ncbi:uncharacterized protein TRAVEDRAFT_47803 [Trametes versicolor FP-101664 SS1]|uniref:uncharacterized protein n=1 Tax=Trametes versicolor (strain FP-101664) TaxID=717944 RepID=UPI0004622C46|nr:uncharacterized protein TRAVEDRAFT_47803 [Trametes versicolor FP-101664 SS1]EIW58661.1 hypothetical protein TRAVEDRAFT_47803 [Trametes versicolor FP-101664 SS1]